MDFYNVESEFMESLDYLSPPVKRSLGTRDEIVSPYAFNNIRIIHKPRNKPITATESVQTSKKYTTTTRVESSTSLVTYERQVQGDHSSANHTNLQVSNQNFPSRKTNDHPKQKDKPLIKVTVIPKTEQTSKAKFLTRRRYTPKRVHSSLSDQENSVRTKNLFLVVAGRRKDKIYEIKTTGSAIFSSDQTDFSSNIKDDLSIDNLSNVRHLIQSLDMGQNKKKDKKHDEMADPQRAWLVNAGNDPYDPEESKSPTGLSGGSKSSNRSRVRIYGQLGVTDDDRYVMRYGATVNDRPVTDFEQMTNICPPLMPLVGCSPAFDDTADGRKDAGIQAGCVNCHRCSASPPMFGKETQGTQVNFNVQFTTRSCQGALRSTDKDVQCSCDNTVDGQPESKSTDIVPKDGKSPLVIISVYPKSSPEDIVKAVKCTSDDKGNQSPRIEVAQVQYTPKYKTGKTVSNKTEFISIPSKDKKNADSKKDMKRVTSPTPSPVKKSSKLKMQEKQVVAKNHKLSDDKKSPDRYKAIRAIKNKILEKDKQRSTSPGVPKIPLTNSKQVSKSQTSSRKPSPARPVEKGTNTAHAKTKKAIVDSYTKNNTEQRKQKDIMPAKLNNSKVTVDINGGQEHYNVLFEQGALTTDLRIRKTMKDVGSQKSPRYNERTLGPLENLSAMPEKDSQPRPMSIECPNKVCTIQPRPMSIECPYKQFFRASMGERVSGITIRDSLELSHRREDKTIKNTHTSISTHRIESLADQTDFLAPMKHYTGDDCSIPDPIERDKEIRVLLGVNRSKVTTPKPLQAHPTERDDTSYQCFYRRECDKTQVTELNLIKYLPSLKKKPDGNLKKCSRKKCRLNVLSNSDAKPLGTTINNYTNPNPDQNCYCKSDHKCVCLIHQGSKVKLNICHCCDCKTSTGSLEYFDKTRETRSEENSIYQQLVLNRYIQVFLQIEQFSKQKPIILTRQQYHKIKKTIQNTLYKKSVRENRKKFSDEKESRCGLGKRQATDIIMHQEVQTEKRTEKPKLSKYTSENQLDKDYKLRFEFEGEFSPPKASKQNKTMQDYQPTDEYDQQGEFQTMESNPYYKSCINCLNKSSREDHHREHTRNRRERVARYRPNEEQHRLHEKRHSSHSSEHHSSRSPKHHSSSSLRQHRCECSDRFRQGSQEVQHKLIEHHEVNTAKYNDYKKFHGIPEEQKYKIGDQLNENHVCQRPNDECFKSIAHCTKQKVINDDVFIEPDIAIHDTALSKYELSRARETSPIHGGDIKHDTCYHKENKADIISTIEHQHSVVGAQIDQPTNVEVNLKGCTLHGNANCVSTALSDCELPVQDNDKYDLNINEPLDINNMKNGGRETETVMLFTAKDRSLAGTYHTDSIARSSMSSMSIQYTSVAYMNHVDMSTDVTMVSAGSSVGHVNSFQTIFRGHRKMPTPNLGTSVYSLDSDDYNSDKSAKFIMAPRDDTKVNKKPFLMRLMSCLVMRSTRTSALKLPTTPIQQPLSINSSIDSYHINTSLAAVEVSSSIYDTSASFYSNHTILPINSKIKRGFFNSVRGFLTNRRS